MISSIWISSALAATALAAPSLAPRAAGGVETTILSEYFQLLASKVQEGRNMGAAPVCDLSKAVLPVASPTPLALPTKGLTLKHVAIGRGIQNYTCSQTDASAAPVALGAVATLFNASCVASSYPSLLALLPSTALEFNLTKAQTALTPSNLAISGQHFFSNATTPVFNLNTATMRLGVAPCIKDSSVAAPTGATIGQGGKGVGAVPWLKLTTRDGATGNLEEVFRVNTAGGSAPTVCTGMPAAFEVQYSAEYWFFEQL